MIEAAIESSQNTSIALYKDGVIFSLDNLNFGRSSDSLFLPCLEDFLSSNGLSVKDVDGWTVGLGPGSFAGIRFALAIVKGFCMATGAKSRGIPSSYAMALAAGIQGSTAVIQNARCGKIYVSLYQCGAAGAVPMAQPEMIDTDSEKLIEISALHSLVTPDKELLDLVPQQIADKITTVPPPSAKLFLNADASRWMWLDTPEMEPVYVRPPA